MQSPGSKTDCNHLHGYLADPHCVSIGLLFFTGLGAHPVRFADNGAAVLLLYVALSRGPVTIVASLIVCYPLLTLILNWLFLGQSIPTRFALAGIFITVAGVGLLLRS